jgi:hypothetical protein
LNYWYSVMANLLVGGTDLDARQEARGHFG